MKMIAADSIFASYLLMRAAWRLWPRIHRLQPIQHGESMSCICMNVRLTMMPKCGPIELEAQNALDM